MQEIVEFVDTERVSHESPLWGKKVYIKVGQYDIINPGFFSSDYVLFTVETDGSDDMDRHKV